MSEDKHLDDILTLLGLGDGSAGRRAVPREPGGRNNHSPVVQGRGRSSHDSSGAVGPATSIQHRLISVERQGDAEWLEIGRGARPLRLTRTKLALLLKLEGVVRAFVGGARTLSCNQPEITLRVGRIWGEAHLIVTKYDWRPIRVSRSNARTFLEGIDDLRRLAQNRWR